MILNGLGVQKIYNDIVDKPKNYRVRMELQALIEKQVTPQDKNIKKVMTAVKRTKRIRNNRLVDVTGLSRSLVNRCLNVLELKGFLHKEFSRNGRESETTIVFN